MNKLFKITFRSKNFFNGYKFRKIYIERETKSEVKKDFEKWFKLESKSCGNDSLIDYKIDFDFYASMDANIRKEIKHLIKKPF
mgnify:FL=1|tara:strand:+ start:490 stop:738 length:249 start_codon:yes stop_codon:yes gene_type:complete